MIKLINLQNFGYKIIKFGLFAPLSNVIFIYGRKLLPVSLLLYLAKRRNDVIEKKIKQIVGKNPFREYPIMEQEKQSPIWYCWLQGEEFLPPVTRLCLESIRKNANGHPVEIVTQENYQEFVKLPTHINKYYQEKKISAAHFSDILRMALLYQHGGFWMDATLFVTKPLPEDIFNQPLFTIKMKEFGFFVSKCRWSGFCIAGWKHNPLFGATSDIFTGYWLKQNSLIDYFLIDYSIDIAYNSLQRVKEMLDGISFNNEYVHDLNKLLCKEYNQEVFTQLTEKTFLFKLSWKNYSIEELEKNTSNFYHHLKAIVKE